MVAFPKANETIYGGEPDEEVGFRFDERGRTHVAAVCHSKSRQLSIFLRVRLVVGLNVEDERKRRGGYRHPMDAKANRKRLYIPTRIKENHGSLWLFCEDTSWQ